MSIYIHIPFCSKICAYCDFPKVIKDKKIIDKYLTELEKEIEENYKGENIKTLYIGGGTPTSLNLKQLKKLFKIIDKIKIDKDAEITIEANSEDLSEEKLKFLKGKVNRLSIGIETFNEDILKEINRSVNLKNIKNSFKYFKNINLDLMYGFKNQKLEDLEKDLKIIADLNPTHISIYSLIIEPNTLLYINNYPIMDEDLEIKMHELIKKSLKEKGYIWYEISNYSKKNFESKHNLVYWNNENYYGFGLGAGGYIKNIRYQNTRSLTKYLNGMYKLEQKELDINEKIQNEFILGLRKINGINKKEFEKKYNIKLEELDVVKELLNKKLLKQNEKKVYINPKYIYTSNEILLKFIDFTLPT
ncbi:MAG: radical SAM family heme chaperone HemW [Bacilli bacterium]|nr:radical SAM family heme chaperone HemW [Bacilli bacterium]MBR3209866.1 radical SAM family heme chaperone HemW [Bacilli bacterium]